MDRKLSFVQICQVLSPLHPPSSLSFPTSTQEAQVKRPVSLGTNSDLSMTVSLFLTPSAVTASQQRSALRSGGKHLSYHILWMWTRGRRESNTYGTGWRLMSAQFFSVKKAFKVLHVFSLKLHFTRVYLVRTEKNCVRLSRELVRLKAEIVPCSIYLCAEVDHEPSSRFGDFQTPPESLIYFDGAQVACLCVFS